MFLRRFLFCSLFTSVLLLMGAGSAMAATYTVTDYNYVAGDAVCDGTCTLTEAINAADANAGQDTIAFSGSGTVTITDADLVLDPQTTDPLGIILDCDGDVTLGGGAIAGPQIIGPSTVKGCTFGGFTQQLTVDGNNATIGGTDSTDRNIFQNWGTVGYNFAVQISADNVTFINNYVGVESDGTTINSGSAGIIVQDAGGVVIGGDAANERNVFQGLGSGGQCFIYIQNNVGALTISGNYLGVNKNGTGGTGVLWGICSESAQSYTGAIQIGGTTAGERNVISNNDSGQINLAGAFADLTVANNYIGLDATGATAELSNAGQGILVEGSCAVLGDCMIGGTTSSTRNVISGNQGPGIEFNGADKWQVQGNYIGLAADGVTRVANGAGNGDDAGVLIENSTNIVIGADSSTLTNPNVIAGNNIHNVIVMGTSDSIVIAGNYIGVRADLSAVVNNVGIGHGIYLNAPSGSVQIGHVSATSAVNIIGGATEDGINISSNGGAVGIYGNYIGTDGTSALGNANNAITVTSTPTGVITVGNTLSAGFNVLSANAGNGILGQHTGTAAHVIKGNIIGLASDGSTDLGNNGDGIRIQDSVQNWTIGSSTADEKNVISGNGNEGIEIDGGSTHTIWGNYIGTTQTGAVGVANGGYGFLIYPGVGETVDDIYVGQNAAGDTFVANVFSANTLDGMRIDENGGTVNDVYLTGNIVGLNKDKDTALANGANGLNLISATDGGVRVSGNYFSGNTNAGMNLSVPTTTITKNYFGTNVSGANLGNGDAGLLINSAATGVIVGYSIGEIIDSGLGKANRFGYNGGGIDNDITSSSPSASLRGNKFDLGAGDTSTNIVFNANELHVSGTSIDTSITSQIAGSTDIADGSKVDIFAHNGTTYVTTFLATATVASGAFQIDGDYSAYVGESAYVQVTNASGQSTKFPSTSTITADSTAPSAPVVTSSSASTTTAAYTLTGTKEAYSSVLNSGSSIYALDSATTWSYATTLSEGANVFSLTSKDYLLNTSSATAFSVTLDTTAPGAPTVTSETAFSSTTFSYDVTITGTKETGASIKNNGIQVVAAGAATTWSYSATVEQGTTVFSFTQVDSVGNTSSATSYSIAYTQTASSSSETTVFGGGGGGGDSGSSGSSTGTLPSGPTSDSTSTGGESEDLEETTGAVSGEEESSSPEVTSPVGTSSEVISPVIVPVIKDVEIKYPLFEAPEEEEVVQEEIVVEEELVEEELVGEELVGEDAGEDLVQIRRDETFQTQVDVITRIALDQPELDESIDLVQNYLSITPQVTAPVVINNSIPWYLQSSGERSQVIPQTRFTLLTNEKVAEAYKEKAEDKDGDRLPDWWEKKYFGNVTAVNALTLTVQGLNMKTAFVFGLNPTATDTDGDGESDVDELAQGNDATLSNTGQLDKTLDEDDDGDGFSNWVERAAGTSGLPEIENGVPVEWAKKNGLDAAEYAKPQTIKGMDKQIQIPFSMRDTDGDGLTDLNEAKYCTDPNGSDTDGDGLSDYDEIFVFYSNAGSCGESLQVWTWVDSDKIYVPRIFNISQEENLFGNDPLLAGVLQPNQRGEILIIPTHDTRETSWVSSLFVSLFGVDSGVKTVEIRADETGKFLSRPSLDSGEYTIVVRAISDEGEIEDETVPYSISVDDSLRADWVMPEQLDSMPIDLESLELITIGNSRPYLYGRVAQKNVEVRTNWASQLYTSSLVVDTDEGEFVALAPSNLENGSHALDVYAFDPSQNLYSSTVHLDFSVLSGLLYQSAMDDSRIPWMLILMSIVGLISVGVFMAVIRSRRSNQMTSV